MKKIYVCFVWYLTWTAHVFYASMNTDESLHNLAQLCAKEFNTYKIKEYTWTSPTDDITLTSNTLSVEKQMITIHIFSQLLNHAQKNKPLGLIASYEDARHIKEAFWNALINRSIEDHTAIKEQFDMVHGDQAFYHRYGNYRTSTQLHAAHNFASKLWGLKENRLITRDPKNKLSIQLLNYIKDQSVQETDQAWEKIAQELNQIT